MEKLSLYIIDQEYVKYLSSFENKVSQVFNEKKKRPFIGIVLKVNGHNFYAPLSSPKRKHIRMKNQVDFYKINRGIYGVINLNNMIPIDFDYLTKVRPIIKPYMSKEDMKYNSLLVKQLIWCNEHREIICKYAEALYNSFVSKTLAENIKLRCCDFVLLEKKLDEYLRIKG